MRRVPNHLQTKVIRWFDYLWLTQKCSDEEKAISCLPGEYYNFIILNQRYNSYVLLDCNIFSNNLRIFSYTRKLLYLKVLFVLSLFNIFFDIFNKIFTK